MKKALIVTASVVVGYVVFLKISEVVQRQATWHSVADPLQQ
ncbi:MAG: hypothetical protein PT944_04645 [Actinomycetaceae bacterium]|nr:hypothetical protein [Actinomycetaceae bacterium]MDY5273085.1 hypothetical protein [Arcanobacterium sp.]